MHERHDRSHWFASTYSIPGLFSMTGRRHGLRVVSIRALTLLPTCHRMARIRTFAGAMRGAMVQERGSRYEVVGLAWLRNTGRSLVMFSCLCYITIGRVDAVMDRQVSSQSLQSSILARTLDRHGKAWYDYSSDSGEQDPIANYRATWKSKRSGRCRDDPRQLSPVRHSGSTSTP